MRLQPFRLALLLVLCSCVADGHSSQAPLLAHFEDKSDLLPGLPATVLRMDLDVNGDGVPELLLSQSQTAGSSGISSWLIYANVGNGQYKLLGKLGFSYLAFRLVATPPSLLAYYRSDTSLGTIVTYKIDSNGVQQVSMQDGVAAGGAEWQKFEDWRKSAGLRVLSVDLRDLETSASPSWTDVIANKPVTDAGPLAGLVIE